MARPAVLRPSSALPEHGEGGHASLQQIQEFIRLYIEVDEAGRRIIEQLVRQSTGRPPRSPTSRATEPRAGPAQLAPAASSLSR